MSGRKNEHGWLVVSTHPSEKYEFVSWGYYSQLNGKIKAMFQTTNQIYKYGCLTRLVEGKISRKPLFLLQIKHGNTKSTISTESLRASVGVFKQCLLVIHSQAKQKPPVMCAVNTEHVLDEHLSLIGFNWQFWCKLFTLNTYTIITLNTQLETVVIGSIASTDILTSSRPLPEKKWFDQKTWSMGWNIRENPHKVVPQFGIAKLVQVTPITLVYGWYSYT